MKIQDNQLQYLIHLCRAKNIPEEEINKILQENSKSDFLKDLETAFTESQVYENIPKKWKEYSKKYVEYVGSLMDPSKIYSTVQDEPKWPNPQVKKKEECRFKKELLNYVLTVKNRALKKYLTDSTMSSENTPKSISKGISSPLEKLESKKTFKEEIETWDFTDDQEFNSKGPVSVDSAKSSNLDDAFKVDSIQTSPVNNTPPGNTFENVSKVGDIDLGVSPQSASDLGKREMEESKVESSQSCFKKIKVLKEEKVQEEINEEPDLQSLREKVLMSRRNSRKEEGIKKEQTNIEESTNEEKDETSLEEGEISSDGQEVQQEHSISANNNYPTGNAKRGRRFEQNNKYKKDDWRERPQSGPSSGAIEKRRAVAPVNSGMASYLNYPAGWNMHQSNNYIGAMPFFRPPVFSMGYNQQHQPPNPYMQIDSNALAKAQMLANMSQPQAQPILPQMSGIRAGGSNMNRPMQYTNSNQTNFWMMNMPHINNGPGFAFAPGNVPQSGSFYSYAGRPNNSHLDPNYGYENPTSRE